MIASSVVQAASHHGAQLGFWHSPYNEQRLKIYYHEAAKSCTRPQIVRPNLVVVNHALPDTVYMLDALKAVGDVKKVFVKPRSINRKAFADISKLYDTEIANREQLADPHYAANLFQDVSEGKTPVVALDVGGYFAKPLSAIQERLGKLFLGVVEDTENGHQKYEKVSLLESCVYSVARSPLKYAEDVLVGYSVALATENIIRSFGDLHCTKHVGILGYGKIGKGAAQTLKNKGLTVSIYDRDFVKLVQASADGFDVYNDLHMALKRSDIIISCTGNAAIKGKDFLAIKNGAYLSSVTSSDDELDFNGTASMFQKETVGDHIELYKSANNHFYLLNSGNAINFIYGPSAGSYITLVHSEIVACTDAILKDHPAGLHEAPKEVRERIAKTWIKTFTPS